MPHLGKICLFSTVWIYGFCTRDCGLYKDRDAPPAPVDAWEDARSWLPLDSMSIGSGGGGKAHTETASLLEH